MFCEELEDFLGSKINTAYMLGRGMLNLLWRYHDLESETRITILITLVILILSCHTAGDYMWRMMYMVYSRVIPSVIHSRDFSHSV